jgi:hypothetical protein
VSRALNYDHNHETGEFRGWVCMYCNGALGLAGDNPELLRALATYLDNKGFAETRHVLR